MTKPRAMRNAHTRHRIKRVRRSIAELILGFLATISIVILATGTIAVLMGY